MEDQILPKTFGLQIDDSNIPYLNEAAKWGKFLSILGFIFIILFILSGYVAITTGNTFTSPDLDTELQSMQLSQSMAGIIIGINFIVFALLTFFPSLYLYNFSSKIQTALRHNDQISLNRSLRNLKSFLKFFGILVIVVICLWILTIIFLFLLGSVFPH